MSYLILINKQSNPVVIEVPEKPTIMAATWDHFEKIKYDQAVKSAIADESKHIHFKDPHLTLMTIVVTNAGWIPNHVYETPKGWMLRFEDACAHDSCPVDSKCEHCKEPIKLAILEKTSDRVDPKPTAVAEPVKVFSEEETFESFETMMFSSFSQGKGGGTFKDWYNRNGYRKYCEQFLNEWVSKKTSLLEAENKRLKIELLDRDVNWLPAKDAEIERLEEQCKNECGVKEEAIKLFQKEREKCESLEKQLKEAESVLSLISYSGLREAAIHYDEYARQLGYTKDGTMTGLKLLEYSLELEKYNAIKTKK